ncbi:MAG: phosphatase [Oscillospiraceae bacterium]
MKLIADTHCHTCASDHAFSTVLENATFASQIGLKYLAITDHAPTLPDAPHPWHFNCLNMIPDELFGVKILTGIEANILDVNGNIDIDESTLKNMKWVVASLHEPVMPPTDQQNHTNAIINTIKNNPIVDTIGHLNSFYFPCDLQKIVCFLKEYERPIEINENSLKKPANMKNAVELVKFAKKYDAKVIINSDAHFALNVGQANNSFALLNQLEFPEKLIINADLASFEDYLKLRLERLG